MSNWITAGAQESTSSTEGFWNAINIWINKPHVVNRRVCGAKICCKQENISDVNMATVLENVQTIQDFLLVKMMSTNVQDGHNLCNIASDLRGFSNYGCQSEDSKDNLSEAVGDSKKDYAVIVVRDLLPRQMNRIKTVREFIFLDKTNISAVFLPFAYIQSNGKIITPTQCAEIPYVVQLQQNGHKPSITIKVCTVTQDQSEFQACTSGWLVENLLPKLVKWSEEEQIMSTTQSLRLVPIDLYNERYQELKMKYAKELVQIWPEKTDPQKYVYEDVGIATYLLLIWDMDRELKKISKKQSFVDLGCGNGLLVHILATEGHSGVGLDVRKRKIWDMYGPSTVLKETSVVPSDENLFAEYDWLIGNHSDELTPWIPVMSARSSYASNFFVLPCCHHDFDSKFGRKVSGRSQYRVYLDFVKEIGETCGFKVEEDTLRIPSTKRVCFIGRSRTYSQDNWTCVNARISDYIAERCVNSQSRKSVELEEKNVHSWAAQFQPRESEEKVRNCTQVNKDIQNKIVKRVFNTLIDAEDKQKVQLDDGRLWNRGGQLSLQEVAELFDKATLQELKSECGGLQTLLKNHHNVFQVVKGVVELRDWYTEDPLSARNQHQNNPKKRSKHTTDSQKFYKTKLCWFYDNHPDGCPKPTESCLFAHSTSDLRHVPPK